MSEASGRSCTLNWRELEELERSMLRRRRDLDDSLSKVFFPECNTVREDDGGLYPYQRVAVELLRSGEALNLLVASPTGSGKTRVIEEAVAVARERGQRIYVCEPLIALVEQIYQRIPGEDVRMLTGPSKKGSEEADVTICTYEVLATKASAQPECLDGCPTIVIDEFHFLGSERGHVLQEILSHCQEGRGVVALSGTMPNVAELAALLSRVNGFPTYVLGAARRPIDLSFYCYSAESRVSRRLLPAPTRPPPFDAQRIGGVRNRQELLSFLRYLSKWDCNPSLLVTFSCRKLDEMANWASSIGGLDRSQRLLVEVAFSKVEKTVPEEDRCLFAVYKQWAQAGVAVHHSHAPVQYLELVSWLAERKALTFIFSSSTLSAGINLPVRTVCLLSARVPKKADGGGVVFEDIDPMLFHQLVGRAGRPGLETRGNCLVLVRRDEDYSSAQALMMSSVPAVQPTTTFETGDILRACRGHRDLAAEMQATADPSQHVLSLSLSLARRLKEEAFKKAEWSQEACEALGRQAEAVAKLLGAPIALLPLCEVPDPRRLVLGLREDGSFEVSSSREEENSCHERTIPLTCAKKTRQIPFQELKHAIDVRRNIEEILEAEQTLKAQCPQERRVLSRICFNVAEAELMLEASPLREELKRQHASLEQQGFLLRDLYGASLTKLGMAACQIRTLPDPTSAVTLLLKLGPLPPLHYLALMSQALQDGPRAEDALSTLSQAEAGDEGLAERLRRAWGVLSELQHVLPPEELGSPLNTLATLCWAEGASLDQIRSFVPVGLFCRHVTRVHDLCCEAMSALSSLDVSPDAFEEAAVLIFRGLPFQRRGAWKTVSEDP